MVRPPSFDSNGMKKGAWSEEEDDKLRSYVLRYGHWNWRLLPKYAGLARCGKSCRLRWVNYLKPGLKRGNLSKQEQDLIIQLHAQLGNKWSTIASKLPGRTDNEIKNFWHTRVEKHMKHKHKNKNKQQQHKRKSSASKKLQLAVKVHTTCTDDDDDGASSFKAVGHHHPELIRPAVGNNPIQPEQLQHYYSRQTPPANHVIIDTYNKPGAEASDHQQLKNSGTKGDTWPDISPPNDTNSCYSPGPNGYCFTSTQPDIAAAAGLEEEQYQFLHCIDLCTGALDYHHLWNINIGDDHGETSTVVLSDLWGPGLGC